MEYEQEVLKLRKQGLSYRKIMKELNCSMTTVWRYCSINGKNLSGAASYKHQKQRRSDVLTRKRDKFIARRKRVFKKKGISTNKNQIIRDKYYKFRSRNNGEIMFTLKELKEKIGDNPKCYLTGRSIDLNDSSDYQLDHIIPTSRGGDNSLENCGIACSEANQCKRDLTDQEFIKLCKEIAAYNS